MQEPRILNDQELVRREELDLLRSAGFEAYPAPTFDVTHLSTTILDEYARDPAMYEGGTVRIAGRMMRKRIMGKAAFIELQDSAGRIQIYLSREGITTTKPNGDDVEVGFTYEELFKKLTSLGDFIGITGYAFRTKTGEISVHAQTYTILSKTLRPLPQPVEVDGVIHDAFSDREQRYRMRYVDLVVNPDVKKAFITRSQIVHTLRSFLVEKGYLEVETPILQPLYGGAYARPFVTHHNTLDMDLYLRIANELYLKRLIVGGFDGVFEFAKDFRNEGMSRFHNPEFTQVELYVAYKDYLWMMDLVEEGLRAVVKAITGGGESVTCNGETISFAAPFARYSFFWRDTIFHRYRRFFDERSRIERICKI